MDHSNEDLILPETDADIHIEAPTSNHSKKRLFFIIFAVIAFVALLGSSVFIILNNKSENPEEQPIAETPETFKYDRDEFNSALEQAEERLLAKDLIAVQSVLSGYSVPERMTASQKYRYYSVLATLYSEENLNKPDLAEKCEQIANESLNEIRKGEE